MNYDELLNGFKSIYGDYGDLRIHYAPGRVNIIGEHIDYNGGHVFPCAISFGNYVVSRKRDDNKLRFYSKNFKRVGVVKTSLDELYYNKKFSWSNYMKGVIWAFMKRGLKITHGFDIYIYGSIPGSGLSSSAAMEVSFGVMLQDYFNFNITPIDIALIGQDAENNFCKTNCGIMDQFASAMGKKGKAIFLDCATLNYQYVPLELKNYKIIVTNSNKPHTLATSHYNDRRRECEEALSDLKKVVDIKNLCQLSVEDFNKYKYAIKDPICLKRADFAVKEEERTKKAVQALTSNDLLTFSRLLNESGDGLRYSYDATCFEIDTLVDEARKQKGCLASRETGGGWGGNTISIVKNEDIEAFKENVGDKYKLITGLDASFNVLEVSDGGQRLL